MTEYLAAFMGIVGVLVGLVLDRAWRWRRPRVSAETGHLARNAVSMARSVFAASLALGGRLPYPWKMADGTSLTAEAMCDALRQASARIGVREFTEVSNGISASLNGVFAAQAVLMPQVHVLGAEETPSQKAHREASEKIAEKQREHAQVGLDLIEPAMALLDRLERHA